MLTNPFGSIFGIQIFTSRHFVIESIGPKKWPNRQFHPPYLRVTKTAPTMIVRVPDPNIYMIGGAAYCHPEVEYRIRQELANR